MIAEKVQEIAYIDCLEALDRARAIAPDAKLITDNPLLAADPRIPAEIENIDRLMPQTDAAALGKHALDIAEEIDRHLAAGYESRPDARRWPGPPLLAGTTSRLVASLLYRGAVLSRMVAARDPGRIHLLIADQPRFDPLQPFLLPYFASPCRPLAEAGFFGAREVSVTPVAAAAPGIINDTAIRSLAGRMAPLPWTVILFEIAGRLGLRLPASGKRVFILGETDTIRETLPWLALRGFAPTRVGKLGATRVGRLDHSAWGAPVGFDSAPPLDSGVEAALSPWLEDRIAGTGEFDPDQSRALATTVLHHLTAGLERLELQVDRARDTLSTAFAASPPKDRVVLTSALVGAGGSQFYALCKEQGAIVVDFEHGATTGLSALARRKIAYCEATTCDVLLAFSENSRQTFVLAALAGGSGKPLAEAIGAPSQLRRVLKRPLQRWLARRHLGNLPRGKPVVMHVSTFLLGGNMRAGWDVPAESHMFDIDRALVTEVYGRIDVPVIFKQYPTQRFLHEPGYGDLIDAAENVRFVKDEDFRYIRAAADVIVTATPTSTLGWCVGTGAPMIYLASRHMNALVDDETDRAFRESFVVVDLDDAGWPAALTALLSGTMRELHGEWAGRAARRGDLIEHAILGPAGSAGRRAASIVADVHGRRGAFAAAAARADTAGSRPVHPARP